MNMYVCIFNTEYQRQFEVLISRRTFRWMCSRYGTKKALRYTILYFYKPHNKKLATDKREKEYRKFINMMFDRNEYTGTIGKTKEECLERKLKRRGLKLSYKGAGEFHVSKARRFKMLHQRN